MELYKIFLENKKTKEVEFSYYCGFTRAEILTKINQSFKEIKKNKPIIKKIDCISWSEYTDNPGPIITKKFK